MTRPIMERMRDPKISPKRKKIMWEIWKWNQLPSFYKREHKAEMKEKIAVMKNE
jgi:hypothetical protein